MLGQLVGKGSRYDDVVACFVFGDVFVYPVSTAEGYVVWKFIVRNARFECGSIRRRDRKRTKHVLAGRREVSGGF
jgi:hypothetical protein